MENLITLEEAAKILGIHVETFRKNYLRGKNPRIPFIRLNAKNYRIRPSDLQDFINASEVKPDRINAGGSQL